MKTVVLGDTHGRVTWKDIVAKNIDFDKLVFLGDFWDTHDNISQLQQIENFKDIIVFKKANIDKVILLFGNHDYHYLKTTYEHYSGYTRKHADKVTELLHEALDTGLLQMCHIEGNYLCSHAGITKTWCKDNNVDLLNVEQSINDLFKHKPHAFSFNMGSNFDRTGDDICQPPIWVRPRSLFKDKIDNFIQIVGHTTVEQIVITENYPILIDALGTTGEYLQIIDGVAVVAV
jgi:predicted phosphodiesterase